MNDLPALLLLALRLLLVVTLYAFFAWALWTMWRDLRTHSQRAAEHETPAITLHFHNANMPGQIRFARPNFFLGREPHCECLIDNPTISARHAQLSFHHNQWWIEDLHSRNGTFLNETPVSEPAALTDEDEIRCGEVTFSIALGKQTQSAQQLGKE